MSRYIDADKAIEIWKDQDYIKLSSQETKARIMLDAVPTADVAEVRHGHWEQEQPQYRLYKCSACNKVCFVERWGDKIVLYDYCPNCGARMDGESDE